jgi:hypothetical protein
MQNPTLKVLSTLTSHGVRHLLMGGQACVFYGATQFSRDVDLAICADPETLSRLRAALDDLRAEVIAVPPFEARYLDRGLAVHFRCQREDVAGFRVDVMSVMHGVDPFPVLWERRTTLQLDSGQTVELIGIRDLVKAKKTQRDKDWPMIAALVEAHYEANRAEPTDERIAFWLRESRSPAHLIRLAADFPDAALKIREERPLLDLAFAATNRGLSKELAAEQARLQELDRIYWQPLKSELEQLRRHGRS